MKKPVRRKFAARGRVRDAVAKRRIQRDGWDMAVQAYESLWQEQLAPAQAKLLELASPAPGERVLDVACGAGFVTFPAARSVGPGGEAVGVDLSGRMVETSRRRADALGAGNARFERMDAESLDFPEASFDAVLCSMGLMYMSDPARALREMRRVLRPGGRLAVSAWGEPARCGLDAAFALVRSELKSDLLPAFVGMGQGDALEAACVEAGFRQVEASRVLDTLDFADDDEACVAAFQGGPIALAWSRLDDETRAKARGRFLGAIGSFRHGRSYRIPAEFVVAAGRAPASRETTPRLAIRDLDPGEAGPLGQLLVDAYSRLDGFPAPAEMPAYYDVLANVGRFLEKPATRVFVAITGDGALAGGVVYIGDMAHYGSSGLATQVRSASGIRFLGVDPAVRGKGVGKALIKACIDLARAQGQAQVILHTTEAMPVARGMYERLGFVRSADLDFSQQGIHVFGLTLNLESDATCIRQETFCATT